MTKENRESRNITTIENGEIIISVFDNEYRVIDVEQLSGYVSVIVIEVGRGSTYTWKFTERENVYVKID